MLETPVGLVASGCMVADSSYKVLCGNQFAALAAVGDEEIEGGALFGAMPAEALVVQDAEEAAAVLGRELHDGAEPVKQGAVCGGT